MNTSNASSRYSSASIAMHWLMLLLLVGVYACIELRELYPKGSDPREALKSWHFTLGLTVFVLVWLRLLLRLTSPTPPIEPTPAGWQTILTKLVHIALYALMIAMPLAGWLILSGEGKPIPFWGLDLPALMGKNKELAETLEEIHETAGLVGYYLIGLHAVAALFHHYFLKDNTLVRMLPGR
jgi:cytochrome b561